MRTVQVGPAVIGRTCARWGREIARFWDPNFGRDAWSPADGWPPPPGREVIYIPNRWGEGPCFPLPGRVMMDASDTGRRR